MPHLTVILGSSYGAGTYGGTAGADDAPRWVVQVGGAPWVDASCDARTVDVRAGRSTYVEAFTAATATVTLANPDGRYSTFPSNSVWRTPDGFVTGVPIRIGVLYQGLVQWRFTGTTDSVEDDWPEFVDARATVQATDGFKNLAMHQSPARAAAGAGELSGARVNRLLDDAQWSGGRAVDAGLVPLQATTLDKITLDELRAVGEAEFGWLFVRGDGALTFRQRDAWQSDPRMNAVQYIFTDTHALAGACYADASVVGASAETVLNVATVTPPGHAASTYQDAASVAHFGPRTWNRTDLLINTDADAVALAQIVVGYYRSDDLHIDSVALDAAARADAWPAAVGCRINDRIRFLRTMPGGWQLDAELLVEGRADQMVAGGDDNRIGEWRITWATANAASVAGLAAWDVATWDDGLWGV